MYEIKNLVTMSELWILKLLLKINYVSIVNILPAIKKNGAENDPLDLPYFIFFSAKLKAFKKTSAIDYANMVPITSYSEMGDRCSSQIPPSELTFATKTRYTYLKKPLHLFPDLRDSRPDWK